MIWFLLVLVAVFIGTTFLMGWVAWQKMLRIEELEDFLIQCYHKAKGAKEKMEKIDHSGAFEADDEVGWTFIEIKNIIDDFSDFLGIEEEEGTTE